MKHHKKTTRRDGVSRRQFSQMLGGGAFASLGGSILPGVARAQDGLSGRQIVFASWGGGYQDSQQRAFCDPFAQRTGAEVIQDGPIDPARLRLMVTQGAPVWNVVDVTASFLQRGMAEGLFEPIDTSIVDSSGVDPAFVTEYGIGSVVYSNAICYSKDAFTEETRPRSYADFFDVENFPGRRTIADRPTTNIEMALLADGVTPEELYPLDLDRAFAKLTEIREHTIFWTTNAQAQQLMADGEAQMGQLTHGRIYDLVKRGANVGIEWNQHLMTGDFLVVLKGSSNVDVSMHLINESIRPEAQRAVALDLAYAPVVAAALEGIPDDILEWMPTAPGILEQAVYLNEESRGALTEEMERRWIQWKLS